MKQDIFSNGARDRPVIPDEEKITLTKNRKIANRARAEAGTQETLFRQAEKSNPFSAKEESVAPGKEGSRIGLSKTAEAQRARIRRSYAKDVRLETGQDNTLDPIKDGGIRTKAEGSRKSAFYTEKNQMAQDPFFSVESLPKKESFHVGEDLSSGVSGKISEKHMVTRRFRKTAETGADMAGDTLGNTVLSDQETDPVSSGTVRTGYGAARLSEKASEKIIGKVTETDPAKAGAAMEAGKASEAGKISAPGKVSRADGLFETERTLSAGKKKAVIDLKASPFFGSQESMSTPESVKSTVSKELQKHLIRKNYQTAPDSVIYIPVISRIRERVRARTSQTLLTGGKSAALKIAQFFEQHPMILIGLIITGILTTLIGAAISGSAVLITHTVSPSTLATSFTAEDEDIKGAESAYRAMEAELSTKVVDLNSNYPGYTAYTLNAGQIGHNPYELAALLTVLHENYTQDDVEKDLKRIFELQYNLAMHDEAGSVGRKTVRVGQSLGSVVTSAYCSCPICCGQWSGGPTASGVMPTANHTIAVDAYNPVVPMGTKVVMNGIEYTVEDTGDFARYGVAFDVYYDDHATAQQHGHQTWEAYIADDNGSQEVEVLVSAGSRQFTADLQNNGLNYVADKLLSKDEKERYDLLMETKGNRPDLFANDFYVGNGSGWFDYSLAGDALSDQKFAGMMAEATKYLGYPYVWGGASPDTSFDCSGFVCWVINHSGNGWNVGRTTADGLCNMLPKVPLSEAKPGDIIFFQGTYDTAGASHVGIIVGDGVMIHCGDPIQYAQYNTPYYQQHFYCVGRLS